MPIPLVDLRQQYHQLREELLPEVERVLAAGQYVLGADVEIFEDRFADYCGAQHCVAVSSGTEALHLALRALGIGPGDEVITAANTFIATALAIRYAGAEPVLVDVDPDDHTIDVQHVEAAITSRTRAIIPVHLYGQPAAMAEIVDVARRHNLRIVEDAAQAHSARIGDRAVGSIGDAGCFSFYPGKNLGAYGDGGAIVTNDDELAAKLRTLRNYGQRRKNEYTTAGFNSRLDTVQAAVLMVKLRHLEAWTEQRRTAALRYGELLTDVDVELPVERPDVRHVYHLYVVRHDHRDEMLEHLRRQDTRCGIHYPQPLNEAAPFRAVRTVPDGVPISASLARRILSLPMFPELTDEQILSVVAGFKSFRPERVAMSL